MDKINKYFAAHPNFTCLIHVSVGLGIAWLISLAWSYSTIALVLGIVFLVIGIAGHIYALLAKQ